MKTKITVVTILMTMFAAFSLKAGDPRSFDTKNSFWSEFVLVQPLNKSKSIRAQMDIQYRTQSEQGYYKVNPNLSNIFLHPYQTVLRPWFHYYAGKDQKMRFSISPIGLWFTYGVAGMPGIVNPTGAVNNTGFYRTPELRTTLQFTYYNTLGRVSLQQRYRYEFRWTGNKQASLPTADDFSGSFTLSPGNNLNATTNRGRIRYMVRGMIALKGTTTDENELYIPFQNEIFLGVGENVKNVNLFDQNRAYLGIGYKTKSKILIELAYLHQFQTVKLATDNGVSTMHFDNNNVLQLWVAFEDFGGLFKKKEKIEEIK